MAETLTEFITRRRQEIEAEEAPLRERMASLKAEKDQLRRAALAAGLEADAPSGSEKPRRGRRPQEKTIKTEVVSILRDEGHGMTALDILEKLNSRNGSTLLRSSLSPQLSRLKSEGAIELTGRFWHLPGQPVPEKEEPDHNLFTEERSGCSDSDPEAHGVEAAPGGGTR